MFSDKITLLHKSNDIYTRFIVENVQWSDSFEKQANSGRIDIARYSTITFPEGTYEGLELSPSNEEDAIFYGVIEDEVADEKGKRISDLLKKYPKSGRIKVVNDNTNRTLLKNIKVVIA